MSWGNQHAWDAIKKARREAHGYIDDAVPKWAPKFLRMSQDSLKTKRHFTPVDLREIEYFSHYTQMGTLAVRKTSNAGQCLPYHLHCAPLSS